MHREFNYEDYGEITWDNEVMNSIAAIHGYSGRQKLYLGWLMANGGGSTVETGRMIATAREQSMVSAAALAGLHTSALRIRKIAEQGGAAIDTEPKTAGDHRHRAETAINAEREICGYRDALSHIYRDGGTMGNDITTPLTSKSVLRLHQELMKYADESTAGHYKVVQPAESFDPILARIRNFTLSVEPEDTHDTVYVLGKTVNPILSYSRSSNAVNYIGVDGILTSGASEESRMNAGIGSINYDRWRNGTDVVYEGKYGKNVTHNWNAAGRMKLQFAGEDAKAWRVMDPLLVILLCTLDFIGIYPFERGTLRMALLLMKQLMFYSGYDVVQYVSVEKHIEQSQDAFCKALGYSLNRWDEGRSGSKGSGNSGSINNGSNDPTYFIKYMLGVIEAAYREFEDRIRVATSSISLSVSQRQMSSKRSASDAVRAAVEQKLTAGEAGKGYPRFKKADICEMVPSVSLKTVERELGKLVEEEVVRRLGGGKATYYTSGSKWVFGDMSLGKG